MTHFEGSMVAIVTPFTHGKINEEALRKLVDFHIANGTSTIVPCGTTGESATLSHDEHERVISIVIDQAKAKGKVKVLAGAGSNNTSEAIRLHQFCQKAGADGSLQITPYYNKPSQEGLYQHFLAIAKSADLPVVLYNVPSRTALNMQAATTIRLSKIDTIVGIKEASGDLVQASMIIKGTADDFVLLSGEDALNFPLYALGAKGAISVTANIAPKACADQYRAVVEGDMVLAQKIHNQLLALHQILFIETNPVPVKAALSLMGYVDEDYRLPLVPMASENREQLKSVLKAEGLIF